MSAPKTLLTSTRAYAVLDVKSKVGKSDDDRVVSSQQVSVVIVWICSNSLNEHHRLEREQSVGSGLKASMWLCLYVLEEVLDEGQSRRHCSHS